MLCNPLGLSCKGRSLKIMKVQGGMFNFSLLNVENVEKALSFITNRYGSLFFSFLPKSDYFVDILFTEPYGWNVCFPCHHNGQHPIYSHHCLHKNGFHGYNFKPLSSGVNNLCLHKRVSPHHNTRLNTLFRLFVFNFARVFCLDNGIDAVTNRAFLTRLTPLYA